MVTVFEALCCCFFFFLNPFLSVMTVKNWNEGRILLSWAEKHQYRPLLMWSPPFNCPPGEWVVFHFLEYGHKSQRAFKMHPFPSALEHLHKHRGSLKIASHLHQGHLWSFPWHLLMLHILNLPQFGASEFPLTAPLISTFFWCRMKICSAAVGEIYFYQSISRGFCFIFVSKEESGLTAFVR